MRGNSVTTHTWTIFSVLLLAALAGCNGGSPNMGASTRAAQGPAAHQRHNVTHSPQPSVVQFDGDLSIATRANWPNASPVAIRPNISGWAANSPARTFVLKYGDNTSDVYYVGSARLIKNHAHTWHDDSFWLDLATSPALIEYLVWDSNIPNDEPDRRGSFQVHWETSPDLQTLPNTESRLSTLVGLVPKYYDYQSQELSVRLPDEWPEDVTAALHIRLLAGEAEMNGNITWYSHHDSSKLQYIVMNGNGRQFALMAKWRDHIQYEITTYANDVVADVWRSRYWEGKVEGEVAAVYDK